jgi:hypothetical protein
MVMFDEGVVSTATGPEARQPRARSNARRVVHDKATLTEIADLRREQERLATRPAG